MIKTAPPTGIETSYETTATVYLDHAASTPLLPEAAQAVLTGQQLAGNPSSRHGAGRQAAAALAQARSVVAGFFGAAPEEVVFTSGGSEANSLALWGTFAAGGFRGHLVTTSIEHPSVSANARALRELGVAVTTVDPAPAGHITPRDLERALRPDTELVSIMHANNETGAIQPVAEVVRIAAERRIPVHVDAVHTAGKLDLSSIGATLISVSAHKFGGPRGVGALSVRAGHRLLPIVRGGLQEQRLRAGTENLPGVLGMAAAVEVCRARLSPDHRNNMRKLRQQLGSGLCRNDGVYIDVGEPVLAETVGVRFDGIRADTLADELDMHGICVSTGSACHAGEESVSRVLTAMGLSREQAGATVRFSFGPDVTAAEIDHVVEVTGRVVRRQRAVAGTSGAAQ